MHYLYDADATSDAVEPDSELDTWIDPAIPPAKDYTVCTTELDCPINGSSCVRQVPFNRTDMDGVGEVPGAHQSNPVQRSSRKQWCPPPGLR
ncbi:MAG: hypothetical protein ACNA8W_14125 [Bradymonadaceae bacterium]